MTTNVSLRFSSPASELQEDSRKCREPSDAASPLWNERALPLLVCVRSCLPPRPPTPAVSLLEGHGPPGEHH